MSFNELNLNENIHKALKACGYTKPTTVQAQCIPEILAKKDLVASAQTGTGKTAAFLLPALQYLSEQTPSKKTRILILTPTRELASQITKDAATLGKFLRFNIVSLVGGMPYYNQIKDLARGADIIVATPGRLIDHIEQKRVDLSNVEMLVLDEADRMLDMGFVDDVTKIGKLTPSTRQTLLFSATIDKQLTTVIRQLLKNPVQIDLSGEKISAPKIKQVLYRAKNMSHKTDMLKQVLSDGQIFKAIIFSATKMNADKLANELIHDGFQAAALHGDLRQNVRNRTIEQLRRGKIQFLIATDVAARGLDISDITHVINYDLPRFSEDYVHRIGRTGRAGKEGIAISFVSPTDTRHLQNIERYIGQRLSFFDPITGEEDTSFAAPFEDRKKSSSRGGPRREFGGFKKPGRSSGSENRFASDKPRTGGFRSRSRDEGDRFTSEKPRSGGFKPRSREEGDRFTSDKPRSPFRERRSEEGNRFASDKPRTGGFRSRSREEGDRFTSEKPRSSGGFRPRSREEGDRFGSDKPRDRGAFSPRSRDEGDRPAFAKPRSSFSLRKSDDHEARVASGKPRIAYRTKANDEQAGAPRADKPFRKSVGKKSFSNNETWEKRAPKKRFGEGKNETRFDKPRKRKD